MYQAINYDSKTNKIHLWDDTEGYHEVDFKPYGYLPDDQGQFIGLDGQRLKKVNKDLFNHPEAYESDLRPEARILIDLYKESDEVSKGHRILYFDIEVDISEKYPDMKLADCDVTAISYIDSVTRDRTVLILDKEKRVKDKTTEEYIVKRFDNEEGLLVYFINAFASIAPTIITGWNTDRFDIPYLLKRINGKLGRDSVNKLSPCNIVKYNQKRDSWTIFGVSSLDYYRLYQNFTYNEAENYRLDTIAKLELGRGKVEYDGDLNTLFTTDIDKFVEYSMVDTDLILALDDKLQFINLAQAISHKGHVSYEDVYFSSRYLDGAAITDLNRSGIIAMNKQHRFIADEKQGGDDFAGAYVMPPIPGLYKWIYDLDLTSLYPSIIMTLNISPETKIGVILDFFEEKLAQSGDFASTIRMDDGEYEVDSTKEFLKANNYAVASNGAVYRTDKKGFLPAILEKWFAERVIFKDKRDEYEVGSPEYKFYDGLQLTQKVLLNSFYGVLGMKTFRFHDIDNAEAITATGQSVIKYSAKVINNFYTTETGTSYFINETGMRSEFSFYTDTDSTFVSSLPIIAKRYPGFNGSDDEFMIAKTNEIAREVQELVNSMYDPYAKVFHNVETHRFQIKQEYVAKSGLWIAKKRYAQWIKFKEGKPTDKLDVKGLDVVRSSFPTSFKDIMTTTLWSILREQTKEQTTNLVMDFKDKIETLDMVDVMKNTSIKELSKYDKARPSKNLGSFASRTPAHVKAGLCYNDMLKMLNSPHWEPLKNGDKVKWAYLKPNQYNFDAIALKGYEDPPEIVEFIKNHIDRTKQFDRELRGKLDDFYAAMNWQALPANNNLNEFFSFG